MDVVFETVWMPDVPPRSAEESHLAKRLVFAAGLLRCEVRRQLSVAAFELIVRISTATVLVPRRIARG